MLLEVIKKSKISGARLTRLKTRQGIIKGPFFMPVATYGAIRNITSQELEQAGAQIALANTYHLNERPGPDLIKKLGGIHKFMAWNKPVLTDSGGFQLFSLGKKDRYVGEGRVKSLVKVKPEGVEFISPIDGSKHFFTPDKVLEIQKKLGVDIAMILDVCAEYPITRKKAEVAVDQTYEWAKKAAEWKNKNKRKPAIFGIIQGSVYKDLRLRSMCQIISLNFAGLAIGGVSVGENKKEMYDVFKWIGPNLPEDKPHYAMGIGYPEDIVEAVKQGIDMFDCVIPTREGRHGKLFVDLNSEFSGDFYKTINITKAEFKNNRKPVDKNCQCPLCSNYSRAYLHHLFKIREGLAFRLAALHNLYFYCTLMANIREAIMNNKL